MEKNGISKHCSLSLARQEGLMAKTLLGISRSIQVKQRYIKFSKERYILVLYLHVLMRSKDRIKDLYRDDIDSWCKFEEFLREEFFNEDFE